MTTKRVSLIAAFILISIGVPPLFAEEDGSPEKPAIAKLRQALQGNRESFPVVAVNTNPSGAAFQSLDLAKSLTVVDGKKYYSFRFQVPESGGSLVWSFRVEDGLIAWFIVPAVGRMRGFTRYENQSLPGDSADLGRQGERFILQRLPRADLTPGSEYIIWFQIGGPYPARVLFSLNIFPATSFLSYLDVFPMLYGQEVEPAGAGDDR
ncbi:MAG: hypothetical protein NTV79_00820 [Candidatus Aureabacteria bacterium]|nr:hypothetical protein [Candidatus Auribacterota bacterium]